MMKKRYLWKVFVEQLIHFRQHKEVSSRMQGRGHEDICDPL